VPVLFHALNQWQSTRAEYDTHVSYGSFVTLQIAGAILAGHRNGVGSNAGDAGSRAALSGDTACAAATEKDVYTARAAVERILLGRSSGLSLAAAHIGFIVAFYMFGAKVGIWAPQEFNYSDAVKHFVSMDWRRGDRIVGVDERRISVPAVCDSVVERLTKSRMLAVIIPAFCWSFLHSAYPQEPAYTRGIEVGILGIVAGIVMLQAGNLATLICITRGCVAGGLLLYSHSMYFKISGVIVGLAALAPIVFSGVAYLRRGHFAAGG